MLDLSQAGTPEAIEVDGVFFAIHTDFRFFLKLDKVLKEKAGKLTIGDFEFIYNTPNRPLNYRKGVDKILEFYKVKKELPRPTGHGNGEIILDYELDADLIFAAFYQVYKIDLLDESLRLHWWKFNALLDGLTGTRLNEVEGFRSYSEGDKRDIKQFNREMLRAWRIEKRLTEDEQKEIDAFDKIFYNA